MARPPTKADLCAQRDRARSMVRTMARVLEGEHASNCDCGRPYEGDCRTMVLLHNVQRHLDHWGPGLDAPDLVPEQMGSSAGERGL